jgi:hypothetical protein
MKRRSIVQHNYSLMNKLLLQTFTEILDSQSNILATWHVTNKAIEASSYIKSSGNLCFCNSWNKQWTFMKIICVVLVCIVIIHNPANGYQQLGGISSSFLWNNGMHLPNYMAQHPQAYSKTMNTVWTAASSWGAYTIICMVHTFVYVYNALLYIYCVHIWSMHRYKKHLCQDHKININLLKLDGYCMYCQF